jgi:uncharacterized protein
MYSIMSIKKFHNIMPRVKRKNESFFDLRQLQGILNVYNPWWEDPTYTWQNPVFKRDVFSSAIAHITAGHDLALLINGPRRVGKTTLMRQLIEHLLTNEKVSPKRILFFSLDDPFIQQLPIKNQGEAFERILTEWESVLGGQIGKMNEPVYCFLDEIQRLPQWELYVKRHVDLKHKLRFVISGSASHTIFRRSLESLLGRLIDISMPPFSFREWVRFHDLEYTDALLHLADRRIDIHDKETLCEVIATLQVELGVDKVSRLTDMASAYAESGGFPQLWVMPDTVEKAQFVDLQYVQRVTLDDLRLVKEIRRPEIFHQFLRYAFARTGEEYNLQVLSGELKTSRATLSDALPLLLQTELIRKVERFANKPVRLRTTHAKLYAADTVLYEAVTKRSASLLGDDKGRIAETLVYNVLHRFAGVTDIMYFRTPDGKREIDFILRIGKDLIPIEVKSGQPKEKDFAAMSYFLDQYGTQKRFGIMVTSGQYHVSERIVEIPIGLFLLLA